MQRLLTLAGLVLVMGVAACGQHVVVEVDQNATSQIKLVTDAEPQATVSEPGNKGAINMHVGDQLHYRIIRTVDTWHHGSSTTDVTAQADFNFSSPAVAAMDVTGQLTAFQPGFTTLEVVYRVNRLDPTLDDKVALDITVLP
jgi:hypothetical protein